MNKFEMLPSKLLIIPNQMEPFTSGGHIDRKDSPIWNGKGPKNATFTVCVLLLGQVV